METLSYQLQVPDDVQYICSLYVDPDRPCLTVFLTYYWTHCQPVDHDTIKAFMIISTLKEVLIYTLLTDLWINCTHCRLIKATTQMLSMKFII